MTNSLHDKWIEAKGKISHSDAVFGALPKNVIIPGDRLYSLRLDSCRGRSHSVDKTLCSRCGRVGGKNARAFGIKVTPIEDRISDECDDCGVSLYELQELKEMGIIVKWQDDESVL